ncbi:S26 family signal peptidase [Sphingosinicella microcystinivorans]|uniref:Chromosome segregation protein ParM n=1 Tax=Sphingosinicella microcystinivorans TaxID=335406 RepID=A0AAD1D7J6_SPHMI|nr:S26 family signal peptidase [Sphingosinicella microcystinivorans]RKS94309.1 conjugative transfer signal peptidase TraF [Sphingosinicella microcystinivorans]BBE35271.1 chromosome segregation protein ParM [Sphingosinicella microcystinivorans]
MTRRDTRGGDLPLIAWGDELRRARFARRRLIRRTGALAALIGLVGTTIAVPPAPRLIWNASASAPIGLYAVAPDAPPNAGDMVIAWVPESARRLAATRRYIPMNVPLVKRVAAVPGDTVCAIGDAVFIDGRRVAVRRAADRMGRAMPWWTGCRTLRGGDYFLLMDAAPASFDGRYFGITDRRDIIGTARLLWAS